MGLSARSEYKQKYQAREGALDAVHWAIPVKRTGVARRGSLLSGSGRDGDGVDLGFKDIQMGMHKGNFGAKNSGLYCELRVGIQKTVKTRFVSASLNGQVEELSVKID